MELDRVIRQWHAFAQLIYADAAYRGQGTGAADNLIAQESIDLIDELVVEEAALNGTTALDENAANVFLPKELEHLRQIDVAVTAQGRQDDAGSHILETAHLVCITKSRRDDDGR